MMASSLWRVGAVWNPLTPMQKKPDSQSEGGKKWGLAVHSKRKECVPTVALAAWSSSRPKLLGGCQSARYPISVCSRVTTVESTCSRSSKSRTLLAFPENQFRMDFSSVENVQDDRESGQTNQRVASITALLALFAVGPAHAGDDRIMNPAYGDVGALLEASVQILYLGALVILLGVGSYLVVRQILIKRELETAAKDLQDRVRGGEASSLEYFELGAVMLRKKFHQPARKYLNEAIKRWDGSEQDLAQVYNALGFSHFSDGNVDQAVTQYEKAVKLQPMYVTAWNNLADAYETKKDFAKALKAYEEALQFDPSNKVASAKQGPLKERVKRLQGIS